MTTAEAIGMTTSLLSDAAAGIARWGRLLGAVLTLSLADDRVAPRRSLVFRLERGGIWAAYGSRFLSRMKIAGARRYPFEEGKYPTPGHLASAAALAVNDLNVAGTRVTLIVPKAWTIVKTAELPLAVKDTLSDVISYELDRLTPLSSERAFYDFKILSEDANRIRILLVAVKTETLEPYLEALREGGITIERVVASLSAIGTLSHYLQPRGSSIFVELHPGGYEGGMIRDGKWRSSFAGSCPPDDEQECIRLLAEEVNPLINTAKGGADTPAVFVHPPVSGQWWNDFRNRIGASIRIIGECDLKPSLFNPERGCQLPGEVLGGILESLWPRAGGMNLLEKGRRKRPKTPLALTSILLAALISAGLFWLMSPVQIEEKRIELIDQEIAARKDQIRRIGALKKEMEAVGKEIAAIDAFKASRPLVINLLREMTQVLPNDVWLSRVRGTDSAVEIEGYAASATAIMPKLEASPYFKKVEFSSSTFRDVRLNADRFIIKMEIEGLPEEKGK